MALPAFMWPVGIGCHNRPADVRLVQQLLNRHRPMVMALLAVDGRMGPITIAAIRAFQLSKLKMSQPDGVVHPSGPTLAALCQSPFELVLKPTRLSKPSTQADYAGDKIAWGGKVPVEFKRKVVEICGDLELSPDLLMAAMAFETGETFSPSVKNAAGSGAVGLIQFMPSTAIGLGTTTEKLAQMSAIEQLDYVKKYFLPQKGKLKTIENVYMAILYPVAIGRSADSVLFSGKTKVYEQNKGLDTDKDGKITVGEAAAKVRSKLEKGLQVGYIG